MAKDNHLYIWLRIKKALWKSLVVGFLGWPVNAHAIELGMTPSHVFGLWTNIHLVIDAYQKNVLKWPVLSPPVPYTVNTFKGKKTADVYARALIVQRKMARVFKLKISTEMPRWITEYGNLNIHHKNSNIMASQVYVLSSQILNASVEHYVAQTQGKFAISPFYATHLSALKTPNDVFALVDLMEQRLKTIALSDAMDLPPKDEGQ